MTDEPALEYDDDPDDFQRGCYGPDMVDWQPTPPPDMPISEALKTLTRLVATDSRDWGQGKGDAIIYAVLVGWGCDEPHKHDIDCSPGGFEAMAERHGWAPEFAALISDMRQSVARCVEAGNA